jgi:cyclophilin family peptidyl-prolyl cis-trans isomerase
MRDRNWRGRSQASQHAAARRFKGARSGRAPLLEVLEDRRLLASLQPISNFSIPSLQGFTLPLLAASNFTHPQTFTVSSSNSDIPASIATGEFWTINVSDPVDNINGPMTFQLFNQLTPHTATNIETFTNSKFYNGTFIWRIASGFPNATGFIVQGGAQNRNGTNTTNPPQVPFANENLQQLAFTGTNQLAMANANPNPPLPAPSNGTQFFITTAQPNTTLGYNFTIFGQLLTGTNILGQLVAIKTVAQPSGGLMGEISSPPNPVNITTASLSATNPNGVAIFDTTQAHVGETSTVTVTATDSVDGSTMSQSFLVTVVPYAGPTGSSAASLIQTINFKPFANPTTANVQRNTAQTIQLNGHNNFPSTATVPLTYSILSQPAHGTISNFNAASGTFTYTPNTGFLGTDSLTYNVTATGPNTSAPAATSNPGRVTITVTTTPTQPRNTGAVQVIGTVLVVTPLPRRDHGRNTIQVVQVPNASASGGAVILVIVNGVLDATQPAVGDLDRLIVFGGNKAKNDIIIDPSVKLNTTIDSGHGLVNFLTGGGGSTREHGWFGHTTLIGGPGTNQLIGLAGRVRFKPSKATNVIFAGIPHRRTALLNPTPPGGTFYKFVHGRLVPVKTF